MRLALPPALLNSFLFTAFLLTSGTGLAQEIKPRAAPPDICAAADNTHLAKVTADRAWFYREPERMCDAPACRQNQYVVKDNVVAVGRKSRPFLLRARFVGTHGAALGWIETGDLDGNDAGELQPAGIGDWLGTWRTGQVDRKTNSSKIIISRAAKPNFVNVDGWAYWHGLNGTEHSGELHGSAPIANSTGNSLMIWNRDNRTDANNCHVKLTLRDPYLQTEDQRGPGGFSRCGGMNVYFDGMWAKQ